MYERVPAEISVPGFEEWPGIVEQNRSAHPSNAPLRACVWREAGRFEEQLRALARSRGLVHEAPVEERPANAPIVMSGHQPVIYHAGLLEKNRTLSRLAERIGARGMNVIVDTDEGDAGVATFPELIGGLVRKSSCSFSDHAGIYFFEQVGGLEKVRECFGRQVAALRGLRLESEAVRAEGAGRFYELMSGEPIILANCLARRASERGAGYREVPLSWLLRMDEIQQFYWQFLGAPRRLFDLYNRGLDEHRRARKIKNPANPFPNLKKDGSSLEMPFWLLDVKARSRLPLYLSEAGQMQAGAHEYRLAPDRHNYGLPEELLVAPRGAMITALLRSRLSDMFIHGLGGAKYDTFTENFFEAFTGSALPRFVTASAGRYLFNAEIDRYEESARWRNKLREVYTHIERYAGAGVFTPGEERRLLDLAGRRRHAIEVNARGPEVHHLSQEIRRAVDESSIQDRIRFAELVKAEELEAWYCRTYPFYLF